jgi:hypothetical protein
VVYLIDMVHRDHAGRITRVHWHQVDKGGVVRISCEAEVGDVIDKMQQAPVTFLVHGRVGSGLKIDSSGTGIVEAPGAIAGSTLAELPQF